MTESGGEVFDLGYQRYDGPREGRVRALKALWVNGVRTALGLGRGSRAQVLPVLLFVAVMAPAVILALVASQIDTLAGPEVQVPGHADYYRIVSIIVLLFSAIIAPELLCPDRRDGVIYLYLVRSLTATDYVVGRWLAFFFITLALVYSGQVVLLFGLVLAAADSAQYIQDNWLDVPRFLAAGLAVAAFTTTLPLAVSAFTTRRAYASVFVIGVFIISVPVAGILTGTQCDFEGHDDEGVVIEVGGGGVAQTGESTEPCRRITGESAKWLALIDIGQVPIHVSDIIFDEENDSKIARMVAELPTYVPVGWYLLLTVVPGIVLVWRYRSIRV